MVYYIGSLRKIRFNRNILYCKYLQDLMNSFTALDLIGTFCIVNRITLNSKWVEDMI